MRRLVGPGGCGRLLLNDARSRITVLATRRQPIHTFLVASSQSALRLDRVAALTRPEIHVCQPVIAPSPPAAKVICPSVEVARKPKWRRRLRRVLRALYRLGQITLVIGPVILIFPFVYFGKKLFPRLRDKYWSYVLWSVEKLGPCMIKFVQWASTRRDILPAEVCDLLEPIQWQTKLHPWEDTAKALSTLDPNWHEVLQLEPDSAMLGSGCVAQVYYGKALASASNDPTSPPQFRNVAVKVIHPFIKEQIELDLDMMRMGAWLLERYRKLQWWSISEFVEEFAEIMAMQMDLRKEAASLERFRANFHGVKDVTFPAPVRPYVNEFVLVEEYATGEPINQIIKQSELDRSQKKKLARVSLQAFLKMAFLDNFVHGDLHPGNIFVSHNSDSHITIIDAGIVTELTPEDRRNFVDLFYAIAIGDGEGAGRLMIERARHHDCVDPDGFCKGIARIVHEARGSGLQLGVLIQEVLKLCLRYRVKLESHFASIMLAVGVLEGVGRSLDPQMNILTAATPIIAKSRLTGAA